MKSLNLQNAWEGLTAYTILSPEAVKTDISLKKALPLLAEKEGILDDELLKKTNLVYIASHTDIRLALCLRGRNIDLVDPHFHDYQTILTVMDVTEKIIDKRVESVLSSIPTFRFPFNFGEGEETVTVRCINRIYVDTSHESNNLLERYKSNQMRIMQTDAESCFYSHANLSPYKPDCKIGLLLGFNTFGIALDRNQEVIDAVVEGGLVMSTEPFECLQVSGTDLDALMASFELSADLQFKTLSKLYEKAGKFEAIKIYDNGTEKFFTCVRKLKH